MKGHFSFKEIALDRIDGSDKRFAFAFPCDVEDLLPSVKESGLWMPLTLQEKGNERFRIVCGHRRLDAAKRVGIRQIPARIVRKDQDDLKLFLEGIRENVATRSVNDIERGQCLHSLVSKFGADRATRDTVMKELGLTPGERLFNQYTSLMRLTGELQLYVVEHNIPIRVSSRLSAWSMEDLRALQRLLKRAFFGGNALKKLVDLIEEIALRDRSSIKEILSCSEISVLPENVELTATQVRDGVLSALGNIRYPRLAEESATLNKLLNKVRPRGVRLDLPPFLEGERIEVNFPFGSVEELKERLTSLGNIADREEIRKILALLRPE